MPKQQQKYSYLGYCSSQHDGRNVIKIGGYGIRVGAEMHLSNFIKNDKNTLLVSLNGRVPKVEFGHKYQVVMARLEDMGGVPSDWDYFIYDMVLEIKSGAKILAYCDGGHGRTGTFLASLIAVMESEDETPDPVAAARERHCVKAVETLEQMEGIFSLRGQSVPENYIREMLEKSIILQPVNKPYYGGISFDEQEVPVVENVEKDKEEDERKKGKDDNVIKSFLKRKGIIK